MARVALVTGGSRGIGASISKALKAAGYKVAANYGGNDAAAEKFKAETGIPVYKFDVSSFDACAAGVKKVEADLGPVDVLVNNAGITRDGAFHKMTQEQWNSVINTNLGSLFNVTRQVIEGMRSRKFGRIVNITSAAVKSPIEVLGLSNGARAGLTGFVAGISRKTVINNVTINGLLPGPFNTDRVRGPVAKLDADKRGITVDQLLAERAKLNPAGRFGDPEEFGQACVFLCGAKSGYITGQNILLDGGAFPGTL